MLPLTFLLHRESLEQNAQFQTAKETSRRPAKEKKRRKTTPAGRSQDQPVSAREILTHSAWANRPCVGRCPQCRSGHSRDPNLARALRNRSATLPVRRTAIFQ